MKYLRQMVAGISLLGIVACSDSQVGIDYYNKKTDDWGVSRGPSSIREEIVTSSNGIPGKCVFYSDVNNNGEFDQETDKLFEKGKVRPCQTSNSVNPYQIVISADGTVQDNGSTE